MGDIGKFCGLYTSGAAMSNSMSSASDGEPTLFDPISIGKGGTKSGLPVLLAGLVGLYFGDGGSFICANLVATGVPP